MRNLSLDPFWRTSIGFDRLFDLMDESLRSEPADHYPPCNIARTSENHYRISLAVAGDESLRSEPADHYPPCNIARTSENHYRISLAVAGFKPEQINVTVENNTLTVTARASEKQEAGEYLYQGIAGRSFQRRFNLADYVVVKGASLENGLLLIDLERELPEAMKPRRIDINVGKAAVKDDKVRTIEHSKAA